MSRRIVDLILLLGALMFFPVLASAADDMAHAGHAGHAADPGNAPAGARSPDYSAGIPQQAMIGMDMDDTAPIGMLRVDQLETTHGREGSGQRWEIQGWYGNDRNKLWLRSEGNRRDARVQEGDIEALWYRPLTAFWGTQLGLRRDLNAAGPQRTWTALGIQGLAPYWFDVEATVYAGSQGRTAARLRSHYDLLLTQRLVLQPEIEANAYGIADPANAIGAGLSDARLALRLRYEIRREFAPYVGVIGMRRFGETAELAQAAGGSAGDLQVVAGLRCWF